MLIAIREWQFADINSSKDFEKDFSTRQVLILIAFFNNMLWKLLIDLSAW
jgi:hypothetical protein